MAIGLYLGAHYGVMIFHGQVLGASLFLRIVYVLFARPAAPDTLK